MEDVNFLSINSNETVLIVQHFKGLGRNASVFVLPLLIVFAVFATHIRVQVHAGRCLLVVRDEVVAKRASSLLRTVAVRTNKDDARFQVRLLVVLFGPVLLGQGLAASVAVEPALLIGKVLWQVDLANLGQSTSAGAPQSLFRPWPKTSVQLPTYKKHKVVLLRLAFHARIFLIYVNGF